MFQVGVRAHTPGTADEFNSQTDTWADPVLQPVYGWAPAGTGEQFEVARTAVTWDLDLYVPSGFTAGPYDRIDVPGYPHPFDIEGVVENFDHGPFGFTPGGRVRLKQTAG